MALNVVVNINRLKKNIANYNTGQEMTHPPPVCVILNKYGAANYSLIIEAIFSHKLAPWSKHSYKYVPKWKGYDDADMSLVPASNLSKAKQMLDKYKQQYRLGKSKFNSKRKG